MRLTQSHRNMIVARAISKAFDKRDADLKKAEAALGVKTYNHIFSADLRKKIASVPREWFRHCDCLSFTVGGQYHRLVVGQEMATPHSRGNCTDLGNITGEIADEVTAHENAKKDAKEQRNRAEIKLSGMLSNVSTFAKLSELWPEGKEFYKDLDEDGRVKGGLPAIRFDDVNSMLGIAKKAA